MGGYPPKKDNNEHIHGGLGGLPPIKAVPSNESLDKCHSGNTAAVTERSLAGSAGRCHGNFRLLFLIFHCYTHK